LKTNRKNNSKHRKDLKQYRHFKEQRFKAQTGTQERNRQKDTGKNKSHRTGKEQPLNIKHRNKRFIYSKDILNSKRLMLYTTKQVLKNEVKQK
jgi:hypothetical protein